jgi:hypothetical protein
MIGLDQIHLLVVSDQVCLLYSHDTASIFSPKGTSSSFVVLARK